LGWLDNTDNSCVPPGHTRRVLSPPRRGPARLVGSLGGTGFRSLQASTRKGWKLFQPGKEPGVESTGPRPSVGPAGARWRVTISANKESTESGGVALC